MLITFENNYTGLHHVAVFESIQASQVRNAVIKNLHVSKRNKGLKSPVHFIDLAACPPSGPQEISSRH